MPALLEWQNFYILVGGAASAIHNAWDNVTYLVLLRRERLPPAPPAIIAQLLEQNSPKSRLNINPLKTLQQNRGEGGATT